MTTPQPPTTPAPAIPDELLAQWVAVAQIRSRIDQLEAMAELGAEWAWAQRDEEVCQARQEGADAELEACCEWLREMELAGSGDLELLRATRRHPAPTLREQALAELQQWTDDRHGGLAGTTICSGLNVALIRKALQEGAND